MAIIRTDDRPAIDVAQGSYTRPGEPWGHLGDPETRARLQAAIAATGRLEYVGHASIPWGGTAFAVGADLLIAWGNGMLLDLEDGEARFKPGLSAVVDFGREPVPSPSLRVEIEEVVHVDRRSRVELLRARLPAEIQPLRLSALPPEELADRDAVLIGYPAFDPRQDRETTVQIFGEVLGTKRLMPGRMIGREPDFANLGPALTHDCSTAGGCGGAPLVDVETGEVLGIHFAGRAGERNFAVPAADLAGDPRFAGAGVLFGRPAPRPRRRRSRRWLSATGRRSATPAAPAAAPDLDAAAAADADGAPSAPFAFDASEAERAAERPRRRGRSPSVADLPDLSAADLDLAAGTSTIDFDPGDEVDLSRLETDRGLEAIVLATGRPVLPVERGRFTADGPWREIIEPHRARADLAVRATGKVTVAGGPAPWVGTAFLVGPGFAVTAAHVAAAFATGSGTAVGLRPGTRAAVDFGEALGAPAGTLVAPIAAVRFIHPYFDVALLELEGVPDGVAALDLAALAPAELPGRPLVVVSFAGEDRGGAPNPLAAIFGDLWGRLFVQPGKAMQLGQHDGRPALRHDCTTAAGSAGGPVVDLGTGYVVGIHTHGHPEGGGYAQPAWELARDPYVWRHEVRFRPDPRPSWLTAWEEPGDGRGAAPRPPEAEPAGAPQPARWTVDRVPIDWQLTEPKALEKLLVLAVDPPMALYWAENAGLDLTLVRATLPPRLLWRELLNKAAVAGRLRQLVVTIADEPQNAGIAGQLRVYL